MTQQSENIVVKNDVGVPIDIDTELADLSGLTLKILFYDPTGALAKTVTASDGGAGPIGRYVSYTTLNTDTEVFNAVGDWRCVPQTSQGSTNLRHGSPPMIVTVVEVGKDA